MSAETKTKDVRDELFNESQAWFVKLILRQESRQPFIIAVAVSVHNSCSRPRKSNDSRLFPDENFDRVDVGTKASVSDSKNYVVQRFPTKNNEIFMSVGWKRTDSGGYECFLEYRKLRLCFVRVCMQTAVFSYQISAVGVDWGPGQDKQDKSNTVSDQVCQG